MHDRAIHGPAHIHDSTIRGNDDHVLADETAGIAEQDEREQVVKSMIGSVIRVELSDGRRFGGMLDCLDCYGNIVMLKTVRLVDGDDDHQALGTVLAPGKHIAKVEVLDPVEKEPITNDAVEN